MGDLRRMIGPPCGRASTTFYDFTREESLVVADEYRAYFDELGPEEYPVFDGIAELLDGLAAQGHRMAVARRVWRQSALTWCMSWVFLSSKPWLA